MNKPIILLILAMTIISACKLPEVVNDDQVQDSLARCDRDNFICPSGEIVMRTGPGCEFICPEVESDFCDYGDPRMDYWGRNAEQCASNTHQCKDGETPFNNKCGCGCQLPSWATGGSYCQEGERYYEQCVAGGQNTCGIILGGSGDCVQEFCKKDYPSRCEACRHQEVIYAATGSC